MTGSKRRKRRAHRSNRSATAASKARPPQTAATLAPCSAEQEASPGRPSLDGAALPKLLNSGAAKKIGRSPVRFPLPAMPTFGRLGLVHTALLPGRVFFAMGRPLPGLVCCVLQASLVGWAPAALWAFQAESHLATKQRGLAARLRPL